MANVLFKVGTRAEYDALLRPDPNTLYWLTDTQELRKGSFLFGTGARASAQAAGLLSPEDKAALDELVESGVSGLHAIDATVVIGSSAVGKSIGVQISAEEGNQLQLKQDGLYVPPCEAGVEWDDL